MLHPKDYTKRREEKMTAYTNNFMNCRSVSALFTHSNLQQKDTSIMHSNFTFISEVCSSSNILCFVLTIENTNCKQELYPKVSF